MEFSDMDFEDRETDVAKLIRAWTNERNSPDLLLFQGELLDGLLQNLHSQAQVVEHLTSDPSTTEEEHLRLTLVQIEMERLKFIVKSYVRARLHKIEKYAPFIMSNPQAQEKLSIAEQMHARRYQELLATHFHTSVLDALPPSIQSLNETFSDGSSMITAPNLDQPVFIYARRDCPNVLLPDGDHVDIAKGSIHLLRYRSIQYLLERQDVYLV